MQQNKSSQLPPMDFNTKKSIMTEDITIEEINYVLSLSTKDGPMKLAEKKGLLIQCLDHILDIKEYSQLFDCYSDSNLCQFFESNFPKD